LLGDFIGYWLDRAMHGVPALWRLHAVHHSSTKLDWPAAARVNPLESIVSKLAAIVPMFLLGFSPAITGIYGPFLGFYPIFIHCNLRWGYGKLARKGSVAALNVSQANVRASPRPRLRFAGARESHVIASPSFHRWHHSADADARDKNFSALFPFYDYLFGTAYFPRDRHPASYGIEGTPIPGGILRQLAYPFRKQSLRS
jgi:sterol desaturase/sphingolipid hydroxylase (fatty acid hydroxylase superfamily)